MNIQRMVLLLGLLANVLGAAAQKQISALVDYAIFPAEQGGGRVLLLLSTEGKSLKYIKNANGKFQASAIFMTVVNDSSRNFFKEKIQLLSPEFADTNKVAGIFTATRTFPLPSGKFQLDMAVYDPHEADTGKSYLSLPIQVGKSIHGLMISDLLFMEKANLKSSTPIFDQPASAFRNSNFFPGSDSILTFYAEATGLLSAFPEGKSMASRIRVVQAAGRKTMDHVGKMQRLKVGPSLAFKSDVDISQLPSGNYFLVWDLIDSTGKVLAKAQKEFKRSNPGLKLEEWDAAGEVKNLSTLEESIEKMNEKECREMVACMLPIANKNEQNTILYLRKKGKEAEVRNYLTEFWKRRSPGREALDFREYRDRIMVAQKHYTTKTMKPFETDRGRVILQYGKPNLVENEQSDRFRKAMTNLNNIPYEVWYYYALENPKQSDVQFVFVQENRGNDNYRLLHSSAIGEVRNNEWRRVVENNGTTNFDWQSPDDRYKSPDNQRIR